jgi:hypothetical protein
MKRVVIALVILSCILAIAAVGYIRNSKKEPSEDAEYVESYEPYQVVYNEIAVNSENPNRIYSSEEFKIYNIYLSYPNKWTRQTADENPSGNSILYSGNDGFLSIGVLSGENIELETAAISEVYKSTQPYGKNPHMYPARIDGVTAIFIIPSGDQDNSMKQQAACIIKYPKPVNINNKQYKYLLIKSTKSKIGVIAKSVKVIK